MAATVRFALAVRSAFAPDGLSLSQSNGPGAYQEVRTSTCPSCPGGRVTDCSRSIRLTSSHPGSQIELGWPRASVTTSVRSVDGQRVVVRARVLRDLDKLAEIAARVQRLDGYPGKHLSDLRAFLVAEDALGAWVAELAGHLVGHVALHRSSLPVVMDRAREVLGVASDDELAVVARLIVDPAARRAGVGRALLEHASAAAREFGRQPILDVVKRYDAANALYTVAGWTNAGEVEMRFADGSVLESYVYVLPTANEAKRLQ